MKKLLPFLFVFYFVILFPIYSQIMNPPGDSSATDTLIELADMRTYFSKTYYNTLDTTLLTRISSGYMHYQKADGSYEDINTRLNIDSLGNQYRMDKGLYRVKFKKFSRGQNTYKIVYDVPRPAKEPLFPDPSYKRKAARLQLEIQGIGLFNEQNEEYIQTDSCQEVTPLVAENQITYPQMFSGIDVRYTCLATRLKEEIIVSEQARNNLPDPSLYGIDSSNAYLTVKMAFKITPNLTALAKRPGRKDTINTNGVYAHKGSGRIDFQNEKEILQFFFPADYARAEADSLAGDSAMVPVLRYFYSGQGKDHLLVGIPYRWIAAAPAGNLIIDPTVAVAATQDVWLENQYNKNSNNFLIVGKHESWPKKRTVIKFDIAQSGIPQNAEIISSRMKLRYYTAHRIGTNPWVDRWVQAHQLLVNWDEAQATRDIRLTGVSWNAPYAAIDGSDAKADYEDYVLFQQDYPTWKEWDLTELTQKWVDGSAANYGVILWANNEDVDSYDLRMYSSEADKTVRPFMEITWSQSLKTVYFLKDHLGSIRATVDENADVVGYDDYDPWGMILDGRSMASAGSGSQGITRNKYQGKEWDDEHGFNSYYFGARYYDPVLGRWCVRDPVGQFASPYVGMGNNPVVLVDPNGEFAFVPIIAGAIIGGYFGAVQAQMNGELWYQGLIKGAIVGGIGGAISGNIQAYGLFQNVGIGALTGGVTGGLNNTLNNGDIWRGAYQGAIWGASFAGISETINYLSNGGGQNNNTLTIKSGEVNNFEVPDPEFIDKAMQEMLENGGALGKEQYVKIKINDTRVLINNTIDSYGSGKYVFDSFWDWVLSRNKIPQIQINASLIFNSNYLAADWKMFGIASDDYITKTVQTLYHESGHLFGLKGFVAINGVRQLKYFSPEALLHSGSHNFYQNRAGNLTMQWLLGTYLKNIR